jgi:hypothetical protein
MKNKIKNLISTIEYNKDHHCEIFWKNKHEICVRLDKLSLDVRGECYQITIISNPYNLHDTPHPYVYYGARHYIKRILKQWLKGEKTLTQFSYRYMLASL